MEGTRVRGFLSIFQLFLFLKINHTFCLVDHLKKISEFFTLIGSCALVVARCQPSEISSRLVTIVRKCMFLEVMSAI